MKKSTSNNVERFHRSKSIKRVIKRIDVPINDIQNIEDAAKTLMQAATGLEKILNYNVPNFRKLQCAQSELQGAAISIRYQDNPGIRAYEECLKVENDANS